MDISLRINKGIERRKSGELINDINNLKACLSIINTLSEDNLYLSWYKDYLKNRLMMTKLNQYLPGIILPNKFRFVTKNAVNKLMKNGSIALKDIKLPSPESDKQYDEYMHIITDTLLTYLFDGIERDKLYSIYSHILFWTEGLYEYKEIQLKTGDIVIDAGASIGAFSALAGVKGCKTYAFEPLPSIIDAFLSKTAKLNPDITICEYALADKQDELYLDEDTDGLLGSSFVILPNRSTRSIKVQTIDLDTFVEKNNLPRVDFIKADIEGAERYMLMGAQKVLKEFAPKISICKYHLPDDPQILRGLILDGNPNYMIEERWGKIYAYVPE